MISNNIKPLPHRSHFYKSFLKNLLVSVVFIGFSLAIGMVGYKYYMNISWVDSLLNASMILTGMGPVDRAETDAAKIFASLYAMYSGVAFLTSVAVLFTPIYTRFMHKMHLDMKE